MPDIADKMANSINTYLPVEKAGFSICEQITAVEVARINPVDKAVRKQSPFHKSCLLILPEVLSKK